MDMTQDELKRQRARHCQTCNGPSRETKGLVCQTCGWDYGKDGEPTDQPDPTNTCPYCGAGAGQHCVIGCPHQYRQQAGQIHQDGADYLRTMWANEGAPTNEPTRAVDRLDAFGL